MKAPLSLNEMNGYEVAAVDGPVGKVKDFFFDDRTWKIKYLDVHADRLPNKRDVLIAPHSVEIPGQLTSSLRLVISKGEVEKSPGIDSDMPVSRQHELAKRGPYMSDVFFSWGESFMGSHNIDLSDYDFRIRNSGGKELDPDLYSIKAVTGFKVNSKDGTSGHVKDFIIDNDTWTINFLVVETGNIFNNKNVVVPVKSITAINDDSHAVMTDLPKMQVHDSPAYDPLGPEPDPFDKGKGVKKD